MKTLITILALLVLTGCSTTRPGVEIIRVEPSEIMTLEHVND